MVGEDSGVVLLATGRELLERASEIIDQMESIQDLEGLAGVTEYGLSRLRFLCERPVTCDQLDAMIRDLREIKRHIEVTD